MTVDVQGAQPEKEDVAVAPGQAELVQRLSQQLELLQKLQTEQEKQLLEARVALTNREAMLTDWQDRAMEMFRLMERILAGGERLNEGYRRAVQDLLKRYTRLMEPLGISPIIPEPGEPFDELLHSPCNVELSEDVPADHVIRCISWGFVVNGQVQIPAEVVIAADQEED